MFFSYTKSDFDCEYIMVNPLIFKSVYTRHDVSSDVIDRVFRKMDFGLKRGVGRFVLRKGISALHSRFKRAKTSKNHKLLPAFNPIIR